MSNLNYQTDEQGIKKAFRDFGFIERVHLNTRRGDGKSLGNAQVQFRSKREALDAVDQMDGTDLDGRPIAVKIFKSWDAYRKEKEGRQGAGMKYGYDKDDKGGDDY